MTFDMALTVTVDVDSGELRFEAGAVGDPSAPSLIEVDGRVAVTEGVLDETDKEIVADPRVERAFRILAGPGSDPTWDWADGVAEAANDCLGRYSRKRT